MKSNRSRLFMGHPIKAIVLSILILGLSCEQNKTSSYVAVQAPLEFSSNIPVDVNPVLQKELKDAGDIYQLNELFNMYSWQALIAINWPLNENGEARENFTDEGTPTWLTWKEAFQVYRFDGKTPEPWDSPRTDSGLGLQTNVLNDNDSRIILNSTTPTHTGNNNIANETDQAFAGKLFDQNGNVVVYEVLMNKEEFDYVVENKLYNINGQLEFSKTNVNANFPKGDFEKQQLGAVEIKLAWKILEDTDYKERYFKDEGYIINESTKKPEKALLGLIGFHISQKTPTGKQWVWSTFEHIDNLDQNTTEVDGEIKVIHPTLTNPNCEICPVNVDVSNNKNTYSYHTTEHGNYWNVTGDTLNYYTDSAQMKTQSKRMVDIPVRVKRINTLMQEYFKQQGSVWQYYQLIDTQYPLDQNAKPGISTDSLYYIPESVVNKPGGKPNLAFLTNISMETFFQGGNQIAGLMENSQSNITIFGTESCIGCHSSAYLFNSYTSQNGKMTLGIGSQLSGDFSWLLKTAQWDRDQKKPSQEKQE
ncbi:hypothetical protein [uncultured Psychroserpens sp.]|uniref:hypothetical protein n=1 Tax=uncultured Psychroserpens sp. TaxID=255436 RepID=UPI00261AFC80|nr:hypothetical protein [uncultured Psychroserpens sp.]